MAKSETAHQDDNDDDDDDGKSPEATGYHLFTYQSEEGCFCSGRTCSLLLLGIWW